MHAAGKLMGAALLFVIINEGVRIRFGFQSRNHFRVFWTVHAICLLMGISGVVLAVREIL